MPGFTPAAKQFSLHKLMAMTTLMSPAHQTHLVRPVVQAGGGDASSEVPVHQLYLSSGIQEHLRRVYDGLRGKESILSRTTFESWLSTTQNQPIWENGRDEYKFEEFLEALWHNEGFEAVRDVKPDEKDLTKPLSNYFISSSHNTYLSGNQLSSKSSTEAYKNVLIRGCRCIEIDVHNGESPDSKSSDGVSTSRSSRSPASPHKPEHNHKRHMSGSTLSSRAASALEEGKEKYGTVKGRIAEKTGLFKSRTKSDEAERGRKSTSKSLEVESIERQESIKSMMNGEPLVLHGWTLTAPVGFRAVCKTVRETAFVTSKLPIIVSLEVHADAEQQEVMVDIMKEEWAGLLVELPNADCNPDERLPRLEELLNKILVKVKRARVVSVDTKDLTPQNSLAPLNSRDTDSIHSGSEDERGGSKKKVKICEKLSNLGVYTHSEHFVSFESKSSKTPSHIYSIGESQIMDLHETRKDEMVAHNRDFFMRAYPASYRIDSSNLDPACFWRKGVQMVALNWQNLDAGMMLNEGMFAGENGWVLKPPGFRSDHTEAIQYKTLDLRVTIYGGQHLPMPPNQTLSGFHPYIKCELHVEKEKEGDSETSKSRKQQTGYQTGDHPDFGAEGSILVFPTMHKVVEELSFLRFKIEDARYAMDNLAAWACIRLDRLQQGYRFVYLLDANGKATAGLLLVKIEKSIRSWR